MRGRCSSARPIVAARLLDGVLAEPSPSFVPQGADGVTYADKIAPADRMLDLERPRGRARAAGPCALAAHRRARRAARPSGDGLAGARGGDGRLRAGRGAAGRRQADGRRGLAARAPLMAPAIAPARAAAFDVIRRVFEDEAYADRALADGHRRPRRPRPGARAAARVRHGAARPHARPRDRDRRPEAGRPSRCRRARGAPARRLPARLPRRRAPLRGRQRVGRARPPGGARAGGAVRERRPPPPRRRGPRAGSRPCRTRRGRRPPSRTRTRTGWPRRGGATSARTARWR